MVQKCKSYKLFLLRYLQSVIRNDEFTVINTCRSGYFPRLKSDKNSFFKQNGPFCNITHQKPYTIGIYFAYPWVSSFTFCLFTPIQSPSNAYKRFGSIIRKLAVVCLFVKIQNILIRNVWKTQNFAISRGSFQPVFSAQK